MTEETKGIGDLLPIIFDNAFQQHRIDGSHKDVDLQCTDLLNINRATFCDHGADPTGLGEVVRNGNFLETFANSAAFDLLEVQKRAIVDVTSFATLQAACNALVAAGGGTVLLPPGYTETITESILIPISNIAIICPTCNAIITDGSANGIVIISLNSADWGVISGIKFVGLGSGKTSTAIATGAGYSERYLITRCWFHDCYTNIGLTRAQYCIVEQCYHTGYANQAIRMNQYPSYNVVRDCYAANGTFANFIYTDHTGNWNHVVRCAVVNCGSGCTAFYARERSRYAATRFSHCYSYINGTGFYVAPPYSDTYAPVQLFACLARLNYSHGFLLHGNLCRAICTDCVAIDNSYTNPNVASGFYIGTARRVILQNCHGYKQARAEQKYGVEVAASSQKAEIRGGRWYPNQTASWLDNGTDTIIDARDD